MSKSCAVSEQKPSEVCKKCVALINDLFTHVNNNIVQWRTVNVTRSQNQTWTTLAFLTLLLLSFKQKWQPKHCKEHAVSICVKCWVILTKPFPNTEISYSCSQVVQHFIYEFLRGRDPVEVVRLSMFCLFKMPLCHFPLEELRVVKPVSSLPLDLFNNTAISTLYFQDRVLLLFVCFRSVAARWQIHIARWSTSCFSFTCITLS